jgi:chemotaxis protein MotA
MDLATLVGLLLGLGAIVGSMVMEGGNPATLVTHPSPIILVIGGSIGATMMGYTMKDLAGIAKVTLKAFMPGEGHDRGAAIDQMVHFADRARRDGLLALEDDAKDIDDDFLQKGIQMAIDGTDPETVREVLETEIATLRERHKVGAQFFTHMGGFAPTVGIIGTVLGLVHALENLDDPSSIGPLIGAAFIATLWGVMTANMIWLPIANKLKRVSGEEVAYKELVLEGILSIQAGANPRTVAEKLKSFLPPAEREDVGEVKKSA